MKNDRDAYVNSTYSAGFMTQGFMITNPMMFPGYMNNNCNNVNEQLKTMENKIKNIENRLSRLEGNYQTNAPYQSTQNNQNYNGEMYMM